MKLEHDHIEQMTRTLGTLSAFLDMDLPERLDAKIVRARNVVESLIQSGQADLSQLSRSYELLIEVCGDIDKHNAHVREDQPVTTKRAYQS